MKKLLMAMVLIACAAAVSAQGLSRRTLGNRLQRPDASAAKVREPCSRTTTENGVEWTYEVVDGGVFLGSGDKRWRHGKVAKLAVPQNTSGTLVIPETLAGMPVRGIGAGAFSSCSELTAVTIPSSVTSIEDRAFLCCSGLTSVTIPSSVTNIGRSAFLCCSGLKSFAVDPGNSKYCSINGMLCSKDGRTLIIGVNGDVTIPSSVTIIGNCAFLACRELTSVAIPSSVTSIEADAFLDCSRLTLVTIPDSVTSIGSGAFAQCSRLTSVTIPPSVTNVGDCVFSDCRKLKMVEIPTSLKDRFGDLSESQKIYIPMRCASKTNGVEWTYEVVGDGVFLGSCDKGGRSGLSDRRTKLAVSPNTSGTLIIPDSFAGVSVRGIGASAFSGCSNLTSVTIPSSVESIGDMAFKGCSGLTSVAILSGVTRVGHGAFSGCDSIRNVVAPGLVGDIDFSQVTNLVVSEGTTHITAGRGLVRETFRDLVSVSIPASVKYIEGAPFSTCRDLKSFSVDASNPSYSSRNGMLCSKDGRMLLVGVNGDVTIPSSVTNISRLSFYGCRGLKSFSVDASNPSYSSRNGMLCSKDGKNLIVGVNGDVTIPSSVTSVGIRAFSCCDGLTSMTIPAGVTNIGFFALFDLGRYDSIRCIKSFSVDASNPSYSSRNGMLFSRDGRTLISGVNGAVTIPEGVTNIGYGAFCYCAGLTSVTIPSSVTSIGGWAFKGCSGLTNVVIPSSVTSIGSHAFSGCMGLKSVTIPSNLTRIANSAFDSALWRRGTLLPSTNGMTTVVFEMQRKDERDGERVGVSTGRSLRTHRLQR